MAYKLQKSVIREIERIFPDNALEVISLFENTTLWADFAGPPARIHFAFLLSSNGNLDRLNKIVKVYSSDWRDLLVETKLASNNWKEVLKNKNIHCDDC